MIEIIENQRRSNVLVPSSLECLKNTPAINLTSGCAHGCIYCYGRGYSTYPGDNRVIIYENILEKLKKELTSKRKRPTVVYFSPSSDIFQPIPQVKELGYSMLEYLLSRNIGIAFLTKGVIPDKTMILLLNNADKVRAQIGIITPDERLQGILEPHTASINTRIKQMKQLISGGVSVEARLMPILPGITDTYESLYRIFQMISYAGIRKAAISTLFLRPGIINSLKRSVPDRQLVNNLLDLYKSSERIPVRAAHSSVVPLPRSGRDIIYSRVKRIAAEYSIAISICGCMNPDIGGSCNIAGKWESRYLQPCLFD